MRKRGTALLVAATALFGVASPADATFLHTVAPGESLSSIAAADGLTIEQLAAANGLPAAAELVTGSQLSIPPQGGGVVETTSSATAVSGSEVDSVATAAPSSLIAGQRYVVQPGDTLTAIAERAGTTVSALAAANGLDPAAPLLSGTTLTVGDAGGEGETGAGTPAESGSAATSQPVGEAAAGNAGGPPYPTSQTVSPSQVEAIAAANGVPPALANGIADMESGFNNALVSSANARGVMQITPGTWSWIDQTLAGPTPLSPESALDNVRAGVLLLRSLLEAAGGNQELAIAGYYQGLPSVLENGMYPSTLQYVDDVEALEQRFGGG